MRGLTWHASCTLSMCREERCNSGCPARPLQKVWIPRDRAGTRLISWFERKLEVKTMSAKHVALLALLTAAVGGGALYAQPQYGNQPPPDQYSQPPDQYSQPQDQGSQPPDQYAQAPVGGEVDVNFFYNKLSPYGHWVQRGGYGWVFLPFGTRAGWRPYTLGHCVRTDYGWTWVSDERFGWATYHYGRWVPDPQYGWGWVPGYEWGPAWVAWRTGGGYIGWAPLPPEVRFRAGVGLDFGGVDVSVSLGPSHY